MPWGIIKGQAGITAQAEEDLHVVRSQHFDNGLSAGQSGVLSLDGFAHATDVPRFLLS
jgi:hypothetical protein